MTPQAAGTGRSKRLVPIIAGVAVLAIAAIVVLLVRGEDDGPSSLQAASADRPNVVWLMTDDQEVATMRMMRQTRKLLGDQGVTFDQAITAWPLCCPSRATFQTGQHAHNHGVLENQAPLGGYTRFKSDEALPVWLQRAGYETGHFGKYMNEYKGKDVPPGWSEWFGLTEPANRYFKPRVNENGEMHQYGKRDSDYSTDLFTRHAAEFIKQAAQGDKPFFVSVGYVAPHVGAAFRTKGPCADNGPEPAPRHDGAFEGTPLPRSPAFNEDDVSDKPGPVRNLPKLSKEVIQKRINKNRCRLESLLAVDESVAAIVKALKEAGELDNTYVFFTSDNGYIYGDHRIEGGKSVFYEPSLLVPLLMRGPGIPQGKTVRDLVSNVDWAPTILDIAGAEPGITVDGVSMLPAARKPDRRQGRALLIESARERYVGVRTDRFVYVEYYEGGEYADDDVEMYDLRRDPYQLENLRDAPEYEREREALAALLDRLRECKGEECEARPRLELSVEGEGDPCRSVTAALEGEDADAVVAARYHAGKRAADATDAGPTEVPVAAGDKGRVHAEVELADGRVVDLEAGLPDCAF